MMVTIAIIGLGMSIVFGFGQALLPQQRLEASASNLATAAEQMRTHALFSRKEIVFAYLLDENGYEAYYPFESDESGRNLGPGRSPILDFTTLERGMAFEKIVFPDGDFREEGVVSLSISALGRVPPHDVIVFNPDYPDLEVRTLRFTGSSLRPEILEGRPEPTVLTDADFR